MKRTDSSCDTLVALGPYTRDGHTLFAKNSDRPPTECQPLFQAPRTRHPVGATVHCQYLTIPQVPETLALLGSRPWWLWGFEHGVNECRVAIGNEALHTRDALGDCGLLGMDLVRLGLERGRSAGEAKQVITDLVEQYGQGGNATYGTARRYHNSFLIADPDEAWVLETSGHHWVARCARSHAAISNLATITDDWDEASAGIDRYARQCGWLPRESPGRLNFREVFEDPIPRYRAVARHERSCRFLASGPPPTVATMMRHLRDHYESGTVHMPGRHDGDPRGWSVCMHPNPGVSATAASMVVDLPSDPVIPLVVWCSLTTPCTSIFLPITLGASLPELLTAGCETPDPGSAWWAMKALGELAMEDPARWTPLVQEAWGALEAGMLAEWQADRGAVHLRLGDYVAEMLRRQRELICLLRSGPRVLNGASREGFTG